MKCNTNKELYVTCPMERKTYPVEEFSGKNNTVCPVCGKLLSDKGHKVIEIA